MATVEWGVFGEEGCVADGFYSKADAAEEANYERFFGYEVYVAEVCPDHPEQERANCEECAAV